jgi:hypothetical protein
VRRLAPPPSAPLRRLLRQSVVLLLAIALSLAYVLATGRATLPPRYNPFAPLDPVETPGLFTAMKLARARADPAACRAALRRAGVAFDEVPEQATGTGCGFRDAVRIGRIGTPLGSPVTATCPLALGLVMMERHVLAPQARALLGSRLARIEHLGTYACRNINHAGFGRRSEHATANAFDLSGVVLADGRRIALTADWNGPDEARRRFLRAARDGACRFFDVTLSPDYNRLHRDHFHVDMGGRRACR